MTNDFINEEKKSGAALFFNLRQLKNSPNLEETTQGWSSILYNPPKIILMKQGNAESSSELNYIPAFCPKIKVSSCKLSFVILHQAFLSFFFRHGNISWLKLYWNITSEIKSVFLSVQCLLFKIPLRLKGSTTGMQPKHHIRMFLPLPSLDDCGCSV